MTVHPRNLSLTLVQPCRSQSMGVLTGPFRLNAWRDMKRCIRSADRLCLFPDLVAGPHSAAIGPSWL